MAGDWIKMKLALTREPEVVGISAKTGLDTFAVVGRLHAFWAWADEVTNDGKVPFVGREYIDKMLSHDGFAEAMEAVGWLKIKDDSLTIPNFDKHNGKSAKSRADAADRRRRARNAVKTADSKSRPEPVTDVSQECHKDVTKKCDKSVTREEKRREEKTAAGSAAAAATTESDQPDNLTQPEIDQRKVYRAIEILNAQTDARGNPIWRPFTNQIRRLADQWVLHNHRDPEELPALIAYGLGKAKGTPAAYLARIIDAGDWEPSQAAPEVDEEQQRKREMLRRHRERRAREEAGQA